MAEASKGVKCLPPSRRSYAEILREAPSVNSVGSAVEKTIPDSILRSSNDLSDRLPSCRLNSCPPLAPPTATKPQGSEIESTLTAVSPTREIQSRRQSLASYELSDTLSSPSVESTRILSPSPVIFARSGRAIGSAASQEGRPSRPVMRILMGAPGSRTASDDRCAENAIRAEGCE